MNLEVFKKLSEIIYNLIYVGLVIVPFLYKIITKYRKNKISSISKKVIMRNLLIWSAFVLIFIIYMAYSVWQLRIDFNCSYGSVFQMCYNFSLIVFLLFYMLIVDVVVYYNIKK